MPAALCLFLAAILWHSPLCADSIIGGETVYVVKKGDNLQIISARLGVAAAYIIEANSLDTEKPLKIGQKIVVNTARIVPKEMENGLIINIPEKALYVFKEGIVTAYPIGLGMPSWRGLTRWRTPVGEFKVLAKQKNPTWYVPESMQWKMQVEGKEVKKIVPPGPDNPLGRFAVKTSIPGVLIHETIWPSSVYRFASHGCVRMLPEHMEVLFEEVKTGTPGEIIYMPVKVAVSPEGRAYLEVHKDIYGKVKNLDDEVRRLVKQHSMSDKVDWSKIELIIRKQRGTAEDVTL
ncbi:MAG: L,D-transpeptidase family protein [Chloroflexota bacterium]